MFDLLSIGDASYDAFVNPTESESLCEVHDKECFICFSYGDKIPVRNLEFSVGGNAANNAVGTSRLGLKSLIVLTLGGDSVGNLILEKLISEKVDTSFVAREGEGRSNYSTVVNYSGERTIFVYHAPRNYKFPETLPATPWIYLTSMGESYKPFYDQFANWFKGYKDSKLVFNPGSWQLRAGLAGMKDILSLTYLLYVNRKEAEKITDFGSSEGREKELLVAVSKLGPKLPVITDGGNGSYAFDGEKFFKCGVLPVDAFERTGAGDAFGSGCLSAIIKGKPLQEALLWGTVNSASVIGYTGAQRGLLTEKDMPVWLERAESSEVKVEEF